jgi:hypothetical protein
LVVALGSTPLQKNKKKKKKKKNKAEKGQVSLREKRKATGQKKIFVSQTTDERLLQDV